MESNIHCVDKVAHRNNTITTCRICGEIVCGSGRCRRRHFRICSMVNMRAIQNSEAPSRVARRLFLNDPDV